MLCPILTTNNKKGYLHYKYCMYKNPCKENFLPTKFTLKQNGQPSELVQISIEHSVAHRSIKSYVPHSDRELFTKRKQ